MHPLAKAPIRAKSRGIRGLAENSIDGTEPSPPRGRERNDEEA